MTPNQARRGNKVATAHTHSPHSRLTSQHQKQRGTLTEPTVTHTRVHQDARAAPLGRDRRQSTNDTCQGTQHYCTAAPAARACDSSVRAPLFFFPFQKKKKIRGGEEGHNHQWHTRTAHSAHTGEQAPQGPEHRTRAYTKGNKGTGHHGLAHR